MIDKRSFNSSKDTAFFQVPSVQNTITPSWAEKASVSSGIETFPIEKLGSLENSILTWALLLLLEVQMPFCFCRTYFTSLRAMNKTLVSFEELKIRKFMCHIDDTSMAAEAIAGHLLQFYEAFDCISRSQETDITAESGWQLETRSRNFMI